MSNGLLSSPSHTIDPALYDESPGSKDKRKTPGPKRPKPAITPSNFTGWTPLVSKTISNEQLLSYNSTPSTKILAQVGQSDFDYANGFNLTPFLNNSINLLGHSAATGFTPFHDKSVHLSDFFIESPIRQSPIKDLETITPSKFRIDAKRPSIFQDPKSAKKSIVSVETPARQPHKLSITTKAKDDDDDTEPEDDKFAKRFETPSKKALADITNNYAAKNTPKGFRTPAKTVQMSSPSTVIMSSGGKSPTVDKALPVSPTPTKVVASGNFKPVMGVFSEKAKPKPRPSSRNRNKARSDHTRFKPTNKAQMQAGMNKFQILLSDGTSKRGRKAGKKADKKKPKEPSPPPQDAKSFAPPDAKSPAFPPSFNFSNDHHANTSKEVSVLTNNSMNASHLNISSNTDHSSFELGGPSSTPNGKFSLEKFFEKPSPQSQQLLNHIFMQQQTYNNMPPPNNKSVPVHNYSHPTMMMMSTPQHQSVYSPNLYQHSENSPEDHNSSMTGFSYSNFRKDITNISDKDKDRN